MSAIRIVCLLVCASLAGTAAAQTSRSGGSAANPNAQAMQQLQQLASERTQLQAENAKLKKDMEEVKQQLKTLQSAKESLERKAQNSEVALSRSASSSDNLNEALAQQRARMEELVGKFRETAGTLREVEADRNTLRSRLEANERDLKSCTDKNTALYTLNAEVLDRLEHQGFWSSVARAEPFTKLKRVELENLADEYRGKAQDQRAGATP